MSQCFLFSDESIWCKKPKLSNYLAFAAGWVQQKYVWGPNGLGSRNFAVGTEQRKRARGQFLAIAQTVSLPGFFSDPGTEPKSYIPHRSKTILSKLIGSLRSSGNASFHCRVSLRKHFCVNNLIYALFIHSFILVISIAPLQVLYYSEALPNTARILYRSFTPKRTGNCR